LLRGEWPHLLTIDGDRTNQLSLLEHRHDDKAARASGFDKGDYAGITLDIGLLSGEVRNVEHLFGLGDAGEREEWMIAHLDHRFPLQPLDDRWRTVNRHCTECIPFPQEQIAELGLAKPSGVRQHGLEHGLQVARRARYDAQHLRGRGLLL
jgi:hypothetical protein